VKLKGSKLSQRQTNSLVAHFVLGRSALQASERASVNRNTAREFYNNVRIKIENEWAEKRRSPCKIKATARQARINDTSNLRAIYGIYLTEGELHLVHCDATCNGQSLFQKYLPLLDGYISLHKQFRNQTISPEDLHFSLFTKCAANASEDLLILTEFFPFIKSELLRYKGVKASKIGLFLTECVWRYHHQSTGDRILSLIDCLSAQLCAPKSNAATPQRPRRNSLICEG